MKFEKFKNIIFDGFNLIGLSSDIKRNDLNSFKKNYSKIKGNYAKFIIEELFCKSIRYSYDIFNYLKEANQEMKTEDIFDLFSDGVVYINKKQKKNYDIKNIIKMYSQYNNEKLNIAIMVMSFKFEDEELFQFGLRNINYDKKEVYLNILNSLEFNTNIWLDRAKKLITSKEINDYINDEVNGRDFNKYKWIMRLLTDFELNPKSMNQLFIKNLKSDSYQDAVYEKLLNTGCITNESKIVKFKSLIELESSYTIKKLSKRKKLLSFFEEFDVFDDLDLNDDKFYSFKLDLKILPFLEKKYSEDKIEFLLFQSLKNSLKVYSFDSDSRTEMLEKEIKEFEIYYNVYKERYKKDLSEEQVNKIFTHLIYSSNIGLNFFYKKFIKLNYNINISNAISSFVIGAENIEFLNYVLNNGDENNKNIIFNNFCESKNFNFLFETIKNIKFDKDIVTASLKELSVHDESLEALRFFIKKYKFSEKEQLNILECGHTNLENVKEILSNNNFSENEIKDLFLNVARLDFKDSLMLFNGYEVAKTYLEYKDFKLEYWEEELILKSEKISKLYNSKILYENLNLELKNENQPIKPTKRMKI